MILILAVNTIPQMGDEEALLRPSVEGGSRMQQTNEFAGHAVEELWFVGARAIDATPDQLRKLNSNFVFGRTRITFIT